MQALLRQVAMQNSFAMAEALWPRADGNCLVQSPAHYCSDESSQRFYSASSEFAFPLQIGIPGRVWKQKAHAWHGDVANLPSTIFLRAELARQCGLHGCVAIPIQVVGSSLFFVAMFFTREVLLDEESAGRVMASVSQLLLQMADATEKPAFMIPEATGRDNPTMSTSRSVLAKSRSWLRCELALQNQPAARTNEEVEDIMKLTRRLEFFKHMAEGQRFMLCKNMRLALIEPGSVLHRSTDAEDLALWRVIVMGRCVVEVTERYGNPPYLVWNFEAGQTVARSYLNLFVNDTGVEALIATDTTCQCLEVSIPAEMQAEFRAWTRPLWYEELTRYFGVSINEAGEILGMCTSAIKKICRRHGISRWPHRKIASVDKLIQTLQSRIEELEVGAASDDTALSTLRTELMKAVRQRMQCGTSKTEAGNADAGEPLGGSDDDDDDTPETRRDNRTKQPKNPKKSKMAAGAQMVKVESPPQADEASPAMASMVVEHEHGYAIPDENNYLRHHPAEYGIMRHQLGSALGTWESVPTPIRAGKCFLFRNTTGSGPRS